MAASGEEESSARLRAVVASLPDIVLTVTRDGSITFVNRIEQEDSAEQVLGSCAFDYVPPEQRGRLQSAVDAVFEQGVPREVEVSSVGRDGQTSWYSSRLTPIFHDGRVAEALIVATDITARKQSEQQLLQDRAELRDQLREHASELERINAQLQESQQFIEQVADTSPFILFVFDFVEQRNVYINSQFTRLLGYPPEALQAMGSDLIARLVHPDDQARIEQNMRRIARAADGEIVEVEYRMRHARGHWLWVCSRNVVFRRNPDGSVRSVLGTTHDITQRRRSGEELERFKFISDHSNDAHFFLDTDARFLYVNRRACDMLGYTESELLRMRVYDIAPGSEERVPRLFQQLKTEAVPPYEAMQVRKDGTMLPVEISVTGVKFSGVPYIFAAVRDVTARKQAEEELRRSRQELQDFVENATVGLHWVGADGRLLWANQAELQMLGYAWNEYVGRHVSEFHADPLAAAALLARLTRGELLREHEVCLRRKDGVLRYVLIDSSPRLENGRVLHTRCFTRDITERREAVLALRESEERLRFILEAARVGTWDWDIRTGVIRWSANMIPIHRLPPETSVGTFNDFLADVYAEDRAQVQQAISDAIDGDGQLHVEYRLAHDGGTRWLEGKGRVIRDAAGAPVRLAGICTDVTARRRAEAALRQRDRLTAVGTLAAGIAHEIKNPLGSMLFAIGAARRVGEQPGGTQIVAECLELIQSESERIDRIVKNVQRFARHGGTEKLPCDVVAVARQSCQRMESHATERGIRLEVDIPHPIPRVVANATEIEQALTNLLSNAVAASSPGGAVTLRVRSEEKSIKVRVEDCGRGMTDEERGQIFDPFYTGREHEGGTGLGMSLVHGIITEHGGNIEVQSVVGQGTTVIICLPLVPPPHRGEPHPCQPLDTPFSP